MTFHDMSSGTPVVLAANPCTMAWRTVLEDVDPNHTNKNAVVIA